MYIYFHVALNVLNAQSQNIKKMISFVSEIQIKIVNIVVVVVVVLSIPTSLLLIGPQPAGDETSVTPCLLYPTSIRWSQEFCPMEYYPQTKTLFPRRLVLLTHPNSEKPLVNNSCKVSLFYSTDLTRI